MSKAHTVTNSAADRAEALAVNEACEQFLDTLYKRLGEGVLIALADTEHVHSRAMLTTAREGKDEEASLDAILTGTVPTTRVVLPVTITVSFGRVARLTAKQLAEYTAAAKRNARMGKVPDPLEPPAAPATDAAEAALEAALMDSIVAYVEEAGGSVTAEALEAAFPEPGRNIWFAVGRLCGGAKRLELHRGSSARVPTYLTLPGRTVGGGYALTDEEARRVLEQSK